LIIDTFLIHRDEAEVEQSRAEQSRAEQ
jgi:hypothetical protein